MKHYFFPMVNHINLVDTNEDDMYYDIDFVGGEHISEIREFCQKVADDTGIRVVTTCSGQELNFKPKN